MRANGVALHARTQTRPFLRNTAACAGLCERLSTSAAPQGRTPVVAPVVERGPVRTPARCCAIRVPVRRVRLLLLSNVVAAPRAARSSAVASYLKCAGVPVAGPWSVACIPVLKTATKDPAIPVLRLSNKYATVPPPSPGRFLAPQKRAASVAGSAATRADACWRVAHTCVALSVTRRPVLLASCCPNM